VADSRVSSLVSFQILLALLLIFSACSGVSSLAPESLKAAQQKWETSGPAYYRMVIEMKGDRMEPSKYEVTVRDKEVIKFVRNGQLMSANSGQEYSVEGLFHVLALELDLTKKPEALGAPPGYSSYPMASFDAKTGRLVRFQRSVAGAKNSIEIDVREFEILGK